MDPQSAPQEQVLISPSTSPEDSSGFGKRKKIFGIIFFALIALSISLTAAWFILKSPSKPAPVSKSQQNSQTASENSNSTDTNSAKPSEKIQSGPANASFILEGKDSVAVGEEFEVNIFSNVKEASNLFDAEITFDPQILEATKIENNGSFVKFFIAKNKDNQKGLISVTGAIPNPGFQSNGKNAFMAVVGFKAKKAGKTKLDYFKDAAIYSNSTNNNILGEKKPLEITVK